MVAAANTDASQATVIAAVTTGNDTFVSQSAVIAAAAYPAADVEASEASLVVSVAAGMDTIVSQSHVIVAALGRVYDPVIRAWDFTLDGHDFYVLRLGNTKTLVYDTHSKSWYNWGSSTTELWRAYNGTNWLGGDAFAAAYGSNVVVGDDGNGALYFLDPTGSTDDDALTGAETPRTYERVVQGQYVLKGYKSLPCFGVQLTGSVGDASNEDLTNVTLYVSDDRGNTYTDCGTITIPNGEYETRVHWRSLGSIKTPGRLFKIVDDGALKRIDYLEMDDDT